MSTAAFGLGFTSMQARLAERRQRREQLEDEARRFEVTRLYDAGHNLAQTIPSLSGDARDRATQQLTDVEEQIRNIYHPQKNPGALQRDWDHLASLIRRKPRPVPVNFDPTRTTTRTTDITIPGSTYDVRPASQAMTRQQQQQIANRLAARWQAQLDVASAGPTPEQQAQAESAKTVAYITQGMKDFQTLKPDATPEERTAHFNDLVTKAYGFAQQRMALKEYQSPDGSRQWFDASRPDLIPSGWTAIAPGAARGGGSDFWKTVTAKYGQNPTAAQIETERKLWLAAGAHGTATHTTVDAAGNSYSVRVPTFAPGQPIPAGLIPPQVAATGDDLATPSDWAQDYQAPADIPAPIASIRPSQQQAGATTAGTTAAAPISTPFAVTPVTPAIEARLQPLGLVPPADPVIVAPDNPADVQAALHEADRLGIGRDVRAVAEYRTDPNSVTSARGGQKTKFLELVQRVNPAWDATKWSAVQQARHSFTAGGLDAKNMQSLGLGVNHLNKLIESYDALGNTEFPDINKARNLGRVHTGYGGVSAVDSAANAVSGEMGAVFKNSGATDVEIQSWRQQFDHNMSPDAFQQSVGTMTDLMAGRMLNEAQNYVNTFGSLKGFPLLAPRTVEILSSFDTDGARLMLEVNREAMESSGIKPPTPGRPTTAPPPPASSAAQPQGGAEAAATITLSHAMDIYKQNHPGEKNITKQMVINDLRKYGQSFVDDLK